MKHSLDSTVAAAAAYAMASLWPGVHFLARNASEFQWMGTGAVVVVLIACVLMWTVGVVVALATARIRPGVTVKRCLFVGVVVLCVAFMHESLRVLMAGYGVVGWPYRLSYAAFAGAGVFAAWRITVHQPARVICFVASVLLLTTAAAPLLSAAVRAERGALTLQDSSSLSSIDWRTPLQRRNVYYVVVDSYGGAASLARYAGIDVRPFVHEMERLGFASLPAARANYITTYSSLMSILEMDYIIDPESPPFQDRRAFFPQALRLGRTPHLVSGFRNGGYEVIHVGNTWTACDERGPLTCLWTASRYGYYGRVIAALLAPTRLPAFVTRLVSSPLGAIHELADGLDELVARTSPFLVFAHNLAPHAPYYRENCAGFDFALAPDGPEHELALYQRSIECVNRELAAFGQRVAERDPDAIVVIHADHGTGFAVEWTLPFSEWTEAAIDERTSILTLIRAPEECADWLPQARTPVNITRFVVGCLQGRQPQFLEDRVFLTAYEGHPDFGRAHEVSGIVRN